MNKLLLRFENGVTTEVGVSGGALPPVFVMTTAEGAQFYFEQRDVLPSGVVVYAEATP